MFSRGHEIDDETEEVWIKYHACKHSPLHIIFYCVVGVTDMDEKVIIG